MKELPRPFQIHTFDLGADVQVDREEMYAAWLQAREDVAAGRYRQENAEEHLNRVRAELHDD